MTTRQCFACVGECYLSDLTHAPGGNASGHIYLKFQFKLVAVKTISWS